MKGIEEGLPEIKSTVTKSMSARLCDKRGVIVLGDAFNMRHPIIASGMMVALSDICILRNLVRPLPNLSNTKKVSELVKSFYIIRKVSSKEVYITLVFVYFVKDHIFVFQNKFSSVMTLTFY